MGQGESATKVAHSGAHRNTHPDSQAVLGHVPCQRIQLFSSFLLIFPFVTSLWAPHRAPIAQSSASRAQTSPMAFGLSLKTEGCPGQEHRPHGDIMDKNIPQRFLK